MSNSKIQRSSVNRQASIARSTPSYRPSPAPGIVDPLLTDNQVKFEPLLHHQLHNFDLTNPNHVRMPLVYPYSSGGYFQGVPTQANIQNSYDIRHDTSMLEAAKENFRTSYPYPEPRVLPLYGDPATISSESGAKSPTVADNEDLFDLPENDTSRLKGVLWPGMSIFDSATPTARRRRNQKKDISIIEQLEANSLDVEPTEMVWTPDGDLKKEKRISGMVDSSSSPWRSSPVRQPRPALAEINIPRPYFNNHQTQHYDTWTNERVETALMYDDFSDNLTGHNKRKRAFEIWQDEDNGGREDDHQNVVLSQPMGFNILTRGFDVDVTHQSTRLCTEAHHSNTLKLPEDPFVSYPQLGHTRQTQPATFDNNANLLATQQCAPQHQGSGCHFREAIRNRLPIINNTNINGTAHASGNFTGVEHDSGHCVPQQQPLQPPHVRAHSRSLSWAISYAQVDQPVSSTAALNGRMPGMDIASNDQQIQATGHLVQKSQDFHALFGAEGFWGFGTHNQSPKPLSLDGPQSLTDVDVGSIPQDSRKSTDYAGDVQQDLQQTHTDARDCEGMCELSDAAEISAYADIQDEPVVKVESNVTNESIQPLSVVRNNTPEKDDASVSDGRTITAPGTPR